MASFIAHDDLEYKHKCLPCTVILTCSGIWHLIVILLTHMAHSNSSHHYWRQASPMSSHCIPLINVLTASATCTYMLVWHDVVCETKTSFISDLPDIGVSTAIFILPLHSLAIVHLYGMLHRLFICNFVNVQMVQSGNEITYFFKAA